MPKIQWTDLPLALRDHLFERLRERKITAEDLFQLKQWRESEPDAPDGPWYKTSAPSRFAAKDGIRKRFCSEARPPRGRDSSLTLTIGGTPHPRAL